LAQWIARLTSNQKVAGSSPAWGIAVKQLTQFVLVDLLKNRNFYLLHAFIEKK
jgi:hypothetical protein